MIVYTATFEPPNENHTIIGVYSTEALALARIQYEMLRDRSCYPNNSRRYAQTRVYYSVEEFEIDRACIVDNVYG